VHVVGLDSEDPIADYQTIVGELNDYDASLLAKDEIILLTKNDLLNQDELQKVVQLFKSTLNHERIYTMTAYDDDSIKEFKKVLITFLDNKKS